MHWASSHRAGRAPGIVSIDPTQEERLARDRLDRGVGDREQQRQDGETEQHEERVCLGHGDVHRVVHATHGAMRCATQCYMHNALHTYERALSSPTELPGSMLVTSS